MVCPQFCNGALTMHLCRPDSCVIAEVIPIIADYGAEILGF